MVATRLLRMPPINSRGLGAKRKPRVHPRGALPSRWERQRKCSLKMGGAADSEDSGGDSSQSIALVSDPEGLQRQWDSVQVGFVDDPRNAVREADALVLATIEELAAGFNDQRSRLEAAWARGGDASTDDLRGAFRTYRDFFERLLSV